VRALPRSLYRKALGGAYGFSVERRYWVVYAQNAPIGIAAQLAAHSFETLGSLSLGAP
jgi:hypothetical protein